MNRDTEDMVKKANTYFKAIGEIWRVMEGQDPTSEVFHCNLCKMHNCINTLIDYLKGYHAWVETQKAEDEIDMAKFKYLSTLSKYDELSDAERKEEMELGLDLVSRGLLRLERVSALDD